MSSYAPGKIRNKRQMTNRGTPRCYYCDQLCSDQDSLEIHQRFCEQRTIQLAKRKQMGGGER